MPKLRILNLSINRLSSLPRGFGAFPVLEVLDLSYNNLDENALPGNFFMMGNWWWIFIQDFQFIGLIQFFTRRNSSRFVLGRQWIRAHPTRPWKLEEFANCEWKKETSLNFSGSEIECLIQMIKEKKLLKISHQKPVLLVYCLVGPTRQSIAGHSARNRWMQSFAWIAHSKQSLDRYSTRSW